VPDVTWAAARRIERERVGAGLRSIHRGALRRPAHGDARDLERLHLQRVLPAGFAAVRSVLRAGEEGVERRIATDGARRVAGAVRERRSEARDEGPGRIGHAIERASGETRVPLDPVVVAPEGLPANDLELDEVDVDRVRVLREVGDLPDLGRADARVLG